MRGFWLRVAIGCNSKPLSRVPIGLGAAKQHVLTLRLDDFIRNKPSSVLNTVSFLCDYLCLNMSSFSDYIDLSQQSLQGVSTVHCPIDLSLCGASSSLARDVLF